MWYQGLEDDSGHKWLREIIIALCRDLHPLQVPGVDLLAQI